MVGINQRSVDDNIDHVFFRQREVVVLKERDLDIGAILNPPFLLFSTINDIATSEEKRNISVSFKEH